MKITVIGSGYVGLVSGACLAEVGNDVLCLDVNQDKINILLNGEVPIYEPGLKEMIAKNVAAKRLNFTTNIDEAVNHGTIQFIAVGTPPDEDGSADLSYVLEAAKNIGKRMSTYKVIVDKSTVPVGTGEKVKNAVLQELQKRNQNLPFSVVSNPEFLKEGAAINDFMKPDRIVIGVEDNDDQAKLLMQSLYAPFQRNHERLIITSIKSAELIKYAANAMLATRISFMNELANLAEAVGADIEMVRQGIGSDSRIGYSFLYSGCGYGGSCFPKDVKALIKTAETCKPNKINLRVLNAVEQANEQQKYVLVQKIKAIFGDDLHGKHFALWGLAFKPNTDDMREAPSRVVINELLKSGATISAYDPAAMNEAKRIYGKEISEQKLTLVNHQNQALQNATALIIVTEWQEFRSPDFALIKQQLTHKPTTIFDGRNLYSPQLMKSENINYFSIGRS